MLGSVPSLLEGIQAIDGWLNLHTGSIVYELIIISPMEIYCSTYYVKYMVQPNFQVVNYKCYCSPPFTKSFFFHLTQLANLLACSIYLAPGIHNIIPVLQTIVARKKQYGWLHCCFLTSWKHRKTNIYYTPPFPLLYITRYLNILHPTPFPSRQVAYPTRAS